jgi:hypothetical protein
VCNAGTIKCVMVKLLTYLTKMVPRGGIEPPTRGFSIPQTMYLKYCF